MKELYIKKYCYEFFLGLYSSFHEAFYDIHRIGTVNITTCCDLGIQ